MKIEESLAKDQIRGQISGHDQKDVPGLRHHPHVVERVVIVAVNECDAAVAGIESTSGQMSSTAVAVSVTVVHPDRQRRWESARGELLRLDFVAPVPAI
jgi:hypothetical protein